MKGPWKAILESLRAGGLPDASLLATLLADCGTMCTYRGSDLGVEHYEEFTARTEDLASAVQAGDAKAALAAAEKMDRLMRKCHDRYK